ncbi:heat shock protein beta-1-like [Channa argus]
MLHQHFPQTSCSLSVKCLGLKTQLPYCLVSRSSIPTCLLGWSYSHCSFICLHHFELIFWDMGEPNKVLSRPIFRRDVDWDPFPNWTQPSRIFAQDFGLPPFLEPCDLDWIDWAKKRLASFSWPGYTQTPVLPPLRGLHPAALNQPGVRELTGGVSEIQTGQGSWKINLDVNHFLPEEITITTREGYLQISGNHEERQDEHETISRCFTRKYKLPQGVDLRHISSSLSDDGVLSVEAPVPGTSISSPANEIVIPVQIRQKQDGEKLNVKK